jgi:hypothetical protein
MNSATEKMLSVKLFWLKKCTWLSFMNFATEKNEAMILVAGMDVVKKF